MTEAFVNLDAQFLAELTKDYYAAELAGFYGSHPAIAPRLLQIARNLQKMDERDSSNYARGFREGRNSALYGGSNLSKVPASAGLEEALASFKGEVTKLPSVEKKSMDPTLTIEDLDL